MKKLFVKLGLALCAGVLLTPAAWAQPDVNDAPKAANPPENVRPRRNMNMQDIRIAMEKRMREMLAHVGVNDATTQTAILDFVQADLQARRPIREQTGKLFRALNGGVTEAQLQALVTDYRAAQEAEKARREAALAELDAKIHYTQNPRLEAILLLAGLIGDGQGNVMFMGGAGRGGNVFGGQAGQGGNAERREQMQQRLLQRFDKDKDGKLNAEEEAAAEQWRKERREDRQQNRNNPQPAADAPANENPAMDAQPDA